MHQLKCTVILHFKDFFKRLTMENDVISVSYLQNELRKECL